MLCGTSQRPGYRCPFAAQHRLPSARSRVVKQPARCAAVGTAPTRPDSDWRKKAKPIKEGSVYPAKENCSHCGLCDTYYVAHVKNACAFLGSGTTLTRASISNSLQQQINSAVAKLHATVCIAGMSKIEELEQQVHGRGRLACIRINSFAGHQSA